MRLAEEFEQIVNQSQFVFIPEYVFCHGRRWRFDYADLDNKIAIELEGGVWVGGRHTRGYGYIKDTKKYNMATVLGWRVLRYCTVKDVRDYFKADYLNLLIGSHGKAGQ